MRVRALSERIVGCRTPCVSVCVCTESRDIFPPFYCYISLILTHTYILFRSDKRHLLNKFKLFISSRLFFPPSNSFDQYEEGEREKKRELLSINSESHSVALSIFPHTLYTYFLKASQVIGLDLIFEIRILNCTINKYIFF